MTIIQLYKLYKEIKQSNKNPQFKLNSYVEQYTLETQNYKIKAEERIPDYDSEAYQYSFSAEGKKSQQKISTDGLFAHLLLSQIRNKRTSR